MKKLILFTLLFVFLLAAFSQGTYRYRRNAHTRKLDLVYIQSVSGGGWTEDGDTTSTWQQ